ncbi:MAG: hypothetical protein R2783_10460, partial [Gelidibacter sp.]
GIVILFNGGVKESQQIQNSPFLNTKWREACNFVKRIDEALKDGEIIIDDDCRKLLDADGNETINL